VDRMPVVSSNIRSVGYDGDAMVMKIEFVDGGVYHYYNVPASTHDGLMNVASKGSYFHRYIRDRYRYRRVA